MDKRKKYILMLDTETANSFISSNGKLDLRDSLVYDIGVAIIDKQGNVYATKSFVISEIFLDHGNLMDSAYYANKILTYGKDILEGTRTVRTIWQARKEILALCKEWNCTTVCAHNARFDYRSLNNTVRYISGSSCRYFFPKQFVWWDTLLMCYDTYYKQKSYRRFCEKYNYQTKHKTPRPQLKAEVLYRYLSGDNSFIESHTGLEDVLIECYILKQCLRQHKKMRKCLFK